MGHLGSKTIASALLCSYLALFWVSALPAAADWSSNPGMAYLREFRHSATHTSRIDPKGWSLYDSDIPINILFQSAWPYDSISAYSKLWGINVPIDEQSLPLYLVNPQGGVQPARLKIAASGTARCTTAVRGAIFRLPRALASGVWTLTITLEGDWTRTVGLAVSTGPHAPFIASLTTHRTGSERSLLLTTYWTQTVRRLLLTAGGAGLPCAAEVEIGYPVSVPAAKHAN